MPRRMKTQLTKDGVEGSGAFRSNSTDGKLDIWLKNSRVKKPIKKIKFNKFPT